MDFGQFQTYLSATETVITLGSGLVAGITASTRLRRAPHRRVWRLSDPAGLKICAATSAITDTGRYKRASTGVGQVRALATVAHSLRTGYKRANVRDIVLSTDFHPTMYACDLILLGGSKNNAVTEQVLAALYENTGFRFSTEDPNAIEFDGQTLVGQHDSGQVKHDIATFLAHDNPFCEGKRVFVISGSHTFGTAAAARLAVDCLSKKMFSLPRRFLSLADVSVDGEQDARLSNIRLHKFQPFNYG